MGEYKMFPSILSFQEEWTEASLPFSFQREQGILDTFTIR